MINELKTKRIPLGNGIYASVDAEDFEYLNQWSWRAVRNGVGGFYAVWNHRVDSILELPVSAPPDISMARVILGLRCVDSQEADHINHDTLNNKKSNLRRCTHSQNCANRKIMLGNSSKYKGVFWHKQSKKWQAQIKVNQKLIYIGIYTNERTAAFAYNLVAKKHFKKFACLNKI